MSIFDGDGFPLNIPLPTMGGQIFWEQLDNQKGYVLQKNIATNHCRILDFNNVRVAWGTETQMRARLYELTTDRSERLIKGDVICVHRINGAYDHYGVYESDQVVYHYAAENGDFGKASVQITTLERFVGNSEDYFKLIFIDPCRKPVKIAINCECERETISAIFAQHKYMYKVKQYNIYSPEETIERARERLGEAKYNLFFNNCEHFAIWCKTGISESNQIQGLLY